MRDPVQGLLTVREQARSARDDAQRALQQAEQQCRQSRAQGSMLQNYRSDTAVRWTTPAGRSTDVIQMGTAHLFLARLDTALQQHELNLQQVQALAERRRAELLAAETRLAALDKLIERRKRHITTQHERREQGAIDQMAQRRPIAQTNPDAHPWTADDAAHHPTRTTPQETQPCPL